MTTNTTNHKNAETVHTNGHKNAGTKADKAEKSQTGF